MECKTISTSPKRDGQTGATLAEYVMAMAVACLVLAAVCLALMPEGAALRVVDPHPLRLDQVGRDGDQVVEVGVLHRQLAVKSRFIESTNVGPNDEGYPIGAGLDEYYGQLDHAAGRGRAALDLRL